MEHGERYRVAYCMHEGDFDDARRLDRGDDGFQRAPRRKKKQDAVDCIMFSPRCVPAAVDPQQEFGW